MKAIQFESYGSSSVLRLVELEPPRPTTDECLVKVHCAGVNPVDWKIRKGYMRFLPGPSPPLVPGFDICGEVVQAGRNARKFKPGDWIYGLLDTKRGGGYAEYAVVKEPSAARKPENVSACEAAALPVAGLTAIQALRHLGGLRAGDHVLIIGASGGVGHLAVQIAQAMGARVTGVCSARNVEWVRKLGADHVIDYRKEDYTKQPFRCEVVFDAAAASSYSAGSRILTRDGVYIRTLPSAGLFLRMLTLPLTSKRRARLTMVKPSEEDLADLNRFVQAGKLRPFIERTYPLQEAAAAHDYSETGHARGKIVIRII